MTPNVLNRGTRRKAASRKLSGSPRYGGRDAVQKKELCRQLKSDAARIGGRDRALSDDLFQEGLLAVLKVKGKHTLAYLRSLGNWRMRDWLRRERRALNHGLLLLNGEPGPNHAA